MKISMLQQWLKNPFQIGTIKPSSKALVDLMLSQVPADSQCIVEFGAGTGPITEGLVQQFPQAKVFSFELQPELADKVQKQFPSVRVLNCNVTEAASILPAEVIGHVDVILSSLPLLSIPAENHIKILESAFQILKPGGSFIQFTYLPFMPPIRAHQKADLWTQFVGMELKNLPPAFVWSFKKLT
ncbi:MAG: hypothetical protein COT73_10110 [Bdellovibrio sp. CG10_big_fil_rev_8_21_14_0_10_47_8]|nr:MAG: hypothetical protein COT73_10110 [Bdellovibrio sp. CG10_big_fil_rev_8_21_14_0_10_47_8]